MKPVLLSALLVLSAGSANAVTISESGDFDGGASFSPVGESNIGLLAAGINTISGSLAGTCDGTGDCNGVSAGDTQDSFLVQIATGYQIDGVVATTSNVSGPTGFGSAISVYKDMFSNNVLFTSMPFNSTSGSLVLAENGDGSYSFSVFGQSASAPGSYSLDWSLEIAVSAVPIPAAVWLFGSGLLGMIGIARRKKAA